MQKNFWIEHSADLTVEAMMLDSKASDLDKEERPEVIIIALSLSHYMHFRPHILGWLIYLFLGRSHVFFFFFFFFYLDLIYHVRITQRVNYKS